MWWTRIFFAVALVAWSQHVAARQEPAEVMIAEPVTHWDVWKEGTGHGARKAGKRLSKTYKGAKKGVKRAARGLLRRVGKASRDTFNAGRSGGRLVRKRTAQGGRKIRRGIRRVGSRFARKKSRDDDVDSSTADMVRSIMHTLMYVNGHTQLFMQTDSEIDEPVKSKGTERDYLVSQAEEYSGTWPLKYRDKGDQWEVDQPFGAGYDFPDIDQFSDTDTGSENEFRKFDSTRSKGWTSEDREEAARQEAAWLARGPSVLNSDWDDTLVPRYRPRRESFSDFSDADTAQVDSRRIRRRKKRPRAIKSSFDFWSNPASTDSDSPSDSDSDSDSQYSSGYDSGDEAAYDADDDNWDDLETNIHT